MTKTADVGRINVTLQLASEPDHYGHGGQAVYGLALEVLRSLDPQLARHIHDSDGPKPLSASPLERNGDDYRFSIGALTRECLGALVGALGEAAEQERLALAGAEAHVTNVEVISTTYEKLHDRASQGNHVNLDFLSPTLFRRSGQSLVLPLPELVFASLLRTWNAFSPLQLPPYETVDLQTLMIAQHRLHTRMTDFGSYRLVGFLGEVRYLIPRDTPALFRHAINCLADYAFFAGVGYRTTMGMGVCRRRTK